MKNAKRAELQERERREQTRARDLVAQVRACPAEYPSVRALADSAGVGVRELERFLREHYHCSAESLLERARVQAAVRELQGRARRSASELARGVGFESVAALRRAFSAQLGLGLEAYSRLGESSRFRLTLPVNFRHEDVFGLFGRDVEGRTERVEGSCLTKALRIDSKPCRLELAFGRGRLDARVHSKGRPSRVLMRDAHRKVCRMLSLAADPAPFERRAARMKGMKSLVARHPGLRIPQTVNVFEALVWVIVGQQVNLTFASTCRSRLIALCGSDAGEGFCAHPTPAQVAQLEYSDLTEMQYSRRKAEYLIDTSRLIADGALDLGGLEGEPTATVIERLSGIRGLGPWSINYLLLRALGREDCVPVGDAGLVAALQRHFDLKVRPNAAETLKLMERFAPFRSLATYHLWKSLS